MTADALPPVTVGDVALRMAEDMAGGRADYRLLPDEQQTVVDLLASSVPLTVQMTGRAIARLRREHDLPPGSDYVWEHFRRTAVLLTRPFPVDRL